MAELNKRQRLFVEAYLGEPNASKAAISAGYSTKTAGSIGNELLKKPEIQALLSERVEKTVMSANEVLTELAAIALADTQKQPHIRTSDKLKALELVGKYHKLFTDKVETTDVAAEIITKAVEAYQDWLNDNPTASHAEKNTWLKRFAQGANIPAEQMAKQVVQIETVQ